MKASVFSELASTAESRDRGPDGTPRIERFARLLNCACFWSQPTLGTHTLTKSDNSAVAAKRDGLNKGSAILPQLDQMLRLTSPAIGSVL